MRQPITGAASQHHPTPADMPKGPSPRWFKFLRMTINTITYNKAVSFTSVSLSQNSLLTQVLSPKCTYTEHKCHERKLSQINLCSKYTKDRKALINWPISDWPMTSPHEQINTRVKKEFKLFFIILHLSFYLPAFIWFNIFMWFKNTSK